MSSTKVNYKGVTFDVEFDYQPDEPQTYDYPGCGASVDVTCIECNGVDFTEFFTEYGDKKEITKVLNDFEQLIWDALAEEYDGGDY